MTLPTIFDEESKNFEGESISTRSASSVASVFVETTISCDTVRTFWEYNQVKHWEPAELWTNKLILF